MDPVPSEILGIPPQRWRDLLHAAAGLRVLVVGDLMLDQFVWGQVRRISPEAPVPVVEYQRESFMPGGAANVARNLTSLAVPTELFGLVGRDDAADRLKRLLLANQVGCRGLLADAARPTSLKTRIIAHQQQIVRLDREDTTPIAGPALRRLQRALAARLPGADAVIVGDYGKGIVAQELLDGLKASCRKHGIWLSVDPKPVHKLDLTGLSLITPNRKEAFELADLPDHAPRHEPPWQDPQLLRVADLLLARLKPALLLITLGDQGMLLCRTGKPPFHIPTVAREVFDVSGAGDTVIASFTLAVAAGASPIEAAVLSNHAAGVVVGKLGTATLTPDELLASLAAAPAPPASAEVA